MSSAITLENATVAFPGLIALKEVSFDIPAGTSLAVIGPSAAGKSVLLKVLAGLHRPAGGSVKVCGVDLATADKAQIEKIQHDVGMLFQQNALFDSLPVWENIAFSQLRQRMMSRSAAKELAASLLFKVGLKRDTLTLFPSDLSGGMQKRVGLARALARQPKIILLDNPTAGLDPVFATHVNNMIEKLSVGTGATVVTVTTEMEVAKSRYDYLAMLHDGLLRWFGPTGEVDAARDAHLRQMIEGRCDGPIEMRIRKRAV